MSKFKNWPGSIIEQAMLERAVGAFLRTHRGGGRLVLNWMASVPPTRSEAGYQAERAVAAGKAPLDTRGGP